MSRLLALRIWLSEARYELTRLLRTPAAFVPSLLLPQMFYLLFAVLLAKHNGGAHGARIMLVGYSGFGMLAAALLGVAAAVAVERERGLDQLKRALPMPPGAWLGAKVVAAMAITGAMTLIMMLLAAIAGHVAQPLWQWPALLGLNLLGVLPFAALGLFIGSRVSGSAAPGVTNLVYLPMSFLSGLWIPLQFLPPQLQAFAPWLPAYHFVQLPLAMIGAGDGSRILPHVLVLIAFTAVFLALAYRRLAGPQRSHAGVRPKWRRLAIGAGIALALAAIGGAGLPHRDDAAAATLRPQQQPDNAHGKFAFEIGDVDIC